MEKVNKVHQAGELLAPALVWHAQADRDLSCAEAWLHAYLCAGCRGLLCQPKQSPKRQNEPFWSKRSGTVLTEVNAGDVIDQCPDRIHEALQHWRGKWHVRLHRQWVGDGEGTQSRRDNFQCVHLEASQSILSRFQGSHVCPVQARYNLF